MAICTRLEFFTGPPFLEFDDTARAKRHQRFRIQSLRRLLWMKIGHQTRGAVITGHFSCYYAGDRTTRSAKSILTAGTEQPLFEFSRVLFRYL